MRFQGDLRPPGEGEDDFRWCETRKTRRMAKAIHAALVSAGVQASVSRDEAEDGEHYLLVELAEPGAGSCGPTRSRGPSRRSTQGS